MSIDHPNRRKSVYNLEFPSWCPELSIFGYRFLRADNYEEQVKRLDHLGSVIAEFKIDAGNGSHALTAIVEIPEREERSVLEWAGEHAALQDILLLLSIFTKREVFIIDDNDEGVITADPRQFQWGGILRVSIPYKEKRLKELSESLVEFEEIDEDGNSSLTEIDLHPERYNVGFEETLNQIYELIRTEQWQRKYGKGYFLFLAKSAFRRQILESAFIQCWTIWEHLFTLHNRTWLTDEEIRKLPSTNKIAFLLVEYALRDNIDKVSHRRISELAKVRNRLIHYGRFPESGAGRDEADLFIRLTEFIIAKIFQLSPSDVFNTVEKLEEFLSNQSRI